MAADASIGSLRMQKVEGAVFDTGLDSLVLTSEQSNTSLVFGEESILKVFRRLSPGPNPDLEVTTALAGLGSSQVAPVARLDRDQAGGRAHQPGHPVQVPAAGDRRLVAGRDQRARPVRAIGDRTGRRPAAGLGRAGQPADVGGDFGGESHRLGVATAQVHADLAAAFGTDELGAEAVDELTERMFRKLDLAVAAVPELAKHVEMISDAYAELARLRGRCRCSGCTATTTWARCCAPRPAGWCSTSRASPPPRWRSAAPGPRRCGTSRACSARSTTPPATSSSATRTQATLSDAARDWVRRNASAFCAGYAEAGGLDPAANQVLLRALQLDKAVYEVLYEARHRPSWLSIPLDSLAEF